MIAESVTISDKLSTQQKKPESTQDSSQNGVLQKKPFLHGITKVINGILTIIVVPTYIFFLFYGVFVQINIFKVQYFALNVSLLLFTLFILTTVTLAIYNNQFKIPRLKKKGVDLPIVGIQVIGRGQAYDEFFAVMNNLRNIKYPSELIKKVVLAVDGNDSKNDDMIKVFLELFPSSIKVQLTKHFSAYTEQQKKQTLQKYQDYKYIIISQPHGGRRHIKYTAFLFSSDQTEYVFHSDSDTLVDKYALINMAQTAAGYNAQNPHLKPCGGVVGQIKIINVVNYFTFHMQMSYWYAFNAGRSSQSALNCVSTISGAMGLFYSKPMKLILYDYATQVFLCGTIQCVFGEDRHLTTGLITNGHSVLYDASATAMTECPKSVHSLIIQQTRWHKGFYRQNFVFLPNIFNFSFWTSLTISIAFSMPILTILHIISSQIKGINALAFFIFFVFAVTIIISLRGILRSGKIRFLHALLHPLFYYFFLMPCKIMAMFDVLFQDNKKICQSKWMKVIHLYVWLILGAFFLIGYGFLYHILVMKQQLIEWLARALIVILALLIILVIHWLTWGLGFFIPKMAEKRQKIYQKARNEGFEQLGQTAKVIVLDYMQYDFSKGSSKQTTTTSMKTTTNAQQKNSQETKSQKGFFARLFS